MTSTPRLFTPLTLRGVTFRNRIVISPMSTYSAEDGQLMPFHQTHYGAFAMGGAGLIMLEQTAVVRQGRITSGDLGLWQDGQIPAMQALVGHAKAYGAMMGIQLNHAGRKSSMQRAFHGNGPLTARDLAAGEECWTPLAPSAVPLADDWLLPEAMSRAQMEGLRDAWAAAARRAVRAGFDVIEIHMAHGYLLQTFLTPLVNQRDDDWGGSRENRMRFPLEVVAAVRAAIPTAMPLFVRISATDGIEGGWTLDDSLVLVRELQARGVDLVDCSSGGNLRGGATNSSVGRGPGFQVPLADRIRHETGSPVAAVGLIRTAEFAESVLAAGSADLICIGRQALFDPYWPRHAAQQLGVDGDFADWPQQYGWWLDKWAQGLARNGETPLGPQPPLQPPAADRP